MRSIVKLQKFRYDQVRKRFGGALRGTIFILGVFACSVDAKDEPEKAAGAAKSAEQVDDKIKRQITEKLQAVRPNFPVGEVVKTEVPGLVRVDVPGGGGSIYMVESGDYFFTGEMYRVDPKAGFVNITEQEKSALRGPLIASVKAEDTIAFKPKGEVKAVINVFTDVDCGYCQKLHREVPALNAKGIEVRYLAFPRAGIPSGSYSKIASAWCADDPKDALTKVKNRQVIETNVCDGNPVAGQYALGQKMGVNGTPAIVLTNGDLIPGYMPADKLASRIGIN
ncbi:MAG: DsbC family protein [Cellvibrionaceae bacterium]|nr:DsbC family protein [Cellvibrionaceae bacterium]